MEVLFTCLVWYTIGLILMTYVLYRDGDDITIDMPITFLIMALLGPIVVLFLFGLYLKDNKHKVLIKRKKKQ